MKSYLILTTLLCGSLQLGYAETEEYQTFEKTQAPPTQTNLSQAHLSTIIQNYIANPESPLSSSDVSELNNYAMNSLGDSYNSLTTIDRSNLSQIINLNSNQFSQDTIDSFNRDQKLSARMSTDDIASLKQIIVDIRDGKVLTPKEVSQVKDFKSLIVNAPYAFIPELTYITQYISFNQGQFSQSDLTAFRQASRDASGLTADDILLLQKIANQNSLNLNREQIEVLRNLAIKAPIGTLNSLDPKTLFILYQIINASSPNFSANSVAVFNSTINNNQLIQSVDKSKIPAPQKETGATSAAER